MRIAIGSDHRGREVRIHLVETLKKQGHDVALMLVEDDGSCDYPDIAFPVGQAVAQREADLGILICGSGIGMCIAANKVNGVRAALVHDEIGADISRRHNDANVMCLPADMLGMRIIDRIVNTWIQTPFEGGRHARRVEKINLIERGGDPRLSLPMPHVPPAQELPPTHPAVGVSASTA